MPPVRTQLVIVGGGAAGTMAAVQLAGLQSSRHMSITLVDSKDYFEYTPAMISVLLEKTERAFRSHLDKVTVDYHVLLARIGVEFVLGTVSDLKGQEVILDNGSTIPFTHLIICTGSTYGSPWKVGSTTMTRQDRCDDLMANREKLEAAQRILIIGGGPVGVELAGEIGVQRPGKQVTLVHSPESLLNNAPSPELGKTAKNVLEHLKPDPVRVILGERAVKQEGSDEYETSKSKQPLPADLVYNCVGITPNSQLLEQSYAHLLTRSRHVQIDSFLRLPGLPNIFALGDVNAFPEEKMLFTAHMQSLHFARNFERILSARAAGIESAENLIPYEGVRISMFISLGPHVGVAHSQGLTLTGWPFGKREGSKVAALGKWAIEKASMNGLLDKALNETLFVTQTNFVTNSVKQKFACANSEGEEEIRQRVYTN